MTRNFYVDVDNMTQYKREDKVHNISITKHTQKKFSLNNNIMFSPLTLTVLVATIDAQWEGMGDVGSARYEPALLPACPTIRVLSYSN